MRKRYDEALSMQGIKCSYQFPNISGSDDRGQPVIDSYSQPEEVYIFLKVPLK